MYIITDTHGTKQRTWTLAGALEWLPYCSEEALIINRLTGRVVAQRTQNVPAAHRFI